MAPAAASSVCDGNAMAAAAAASSGVTYLTSKTPAVSLTCTKMHSKRYFTIVRPSICTHLQNAEGLMMVP